MTEKKTYPTAPKSPPPSTKKPGGTGTTTKPANKGKDTGGKKKAKDPNAQARADARAAEKRAVAREKEAKGKAGKRFLEGAANLSVQAKALRQALNVEFASNRDIKLASITKMLGEQVGLLRAGHESKAGEFLKMGEDAEMATAGAAERGFSNAVREQQDTMTGILEQGAGETDAMKAMLMSARNWQSNAAENNRTYFDSMRSINSEINDLNVGSRAELAKAYGGAESDRERTWQDFYNRRNEAFTTLGNVLGQQADLYAQAKEMGVKPKKGAEKAAEDAMKKAFASAAEESGKSYTAQALPEWIKDYGTQQMQAKQSNTELAAAVTLDKVAKAEGATLRKWEAA